MSRPEDNPTEHERMTKDRSESESMNTESESQAAEEELNVYVRNETTYLVGNPANGTAYLVNMCDPEHDDVATCKCGDYRFRAQDGENRACKHIQAVIREGPSAIGIEKMAYDSLSSQAELLTQKVDRVTQRLSSLQADTVAESQTASVNASDAAGDGTQMQEVSVQEAAEKLQEAYDNATKGMNVEAHAGKVWVNKSPDAPDYTFDAFLSGPQLMKYDPDGDSPGQYFKNYIDASDVEQYIREVLE